MPKKISEKFFSENTGKILAVGGIVCIITSMIIYLMLGNWSFSIVLDEEKIGQFGDFIGGVVGSFFSLAGVILFYVALKEQRKDININQNNLSIQTDALQQQVEEFKAQKEELEATRKVYEEQTLLIREQTNLYKQQNKELKEQTTTAKLQQFDSSFFSYLGVFSECKEKLNQSCDSKNFFGDIVSEISSIDVRNMSLKKSLDDIKNQYLNVFYSNKVFLPLYFKTLYRIMILIDSSNIDELKKQEYFKLLRSQISDEEQLILYYNYQTYLGVKVRPYVIKYNFLKHINTLDKIEFCCSLSNQPKFEMEKFLSEIERYILETIIRFSSIEEENDVDFSTSYPILDIVLIVKIKINGTFEFSLVFNKNEFEVHQFLNKEILVLFITRQIYSVLFLSKYKEFNENEIIDSIIESQGNIEFKFTINDIESI